MPTKKKIAGEDKSSLDVEQIKEEIFLLLTGQQLDTKEFDYLKLARRVTIILIGVYGISKIGIVRQLAFSIASMLVTRWIAAQAVDSVLPVALVESDGRRTKRALPLRTPAALAAPRHRVAH